MSRTKRICPRRHIQVREGQAQHKCKCEWCRNVDKKKAVEKFYDNQIKQYDNGD